MEKKKKNEINDIYSSKIRGMGSRNKEKNEENINWKMENQ